MNILNYKASKIIIMFLRKIHRVRGKRFILKALRQMIGEKYLIADYYSGKIVLNEKEFIDYSVCINGHYEKDVWGTISSNISYNEVFWDVGANIGTVSIPALLDRRISQVYCFEPNPIVFKQLKYNLELNKGNFFAYNCALGSENQELPLYIGHTRNSGSNSLFYNRDNGFFLINCVTIDYLIENDKVHPPTILKLDVEGWEEHVLQGAKNLFIKAPPKLVIFESTSDFEGRCRHDRIIKFLQHYDYEVIDLSLPSDSGQGVGSYLAKLNPKT